MINAKDELLEHIGDRAVEKVKVKFCINGKEIEILGSLEEVIKSLDFEYHEGYGGQELYGFIWYADGTWSERGEYDGSEWWKHVKRPGYDVELEHWLMG